jgi:hypothetical protein
MADHGAQWRTMALNRGPACQVSSAFFGLALGVMDLHHGIQYDIADSQGKQPWRWMIVALVHSGGLFMVVNKQHCSLLLSTATPTPWQKASLSIGPHDDMCPARHC